MSYLGDIRTKIPGLELRENEPMSRHCSFKIGGPVSVMALPNGAEQLEELCYFLRQRGVQPLIIGNGTNLLVTDDIIDRFVIKLSDGISEVSQCGETEVLAQSGVTLARLASRCADWGLAGLEFAHGIPGSLGGGIFMNAGAYGGEIKDVLRAVRYLDGNANLIEKRCEELELSYRHSIFSDSNWVIVEAVLELTPGDSREIRANMHELSEKRRISQPLSEPSAGSAFKRPATGYAAALIDEAGLKGYTIGGAQVSKKHAGFIVNRGGASFHDVMLLIEYIQKTVFARTGIVLEPEVKIIKATT